MKKTVNMPFQIVGLGLLLTLMPTFAAQQIKSLITAAKGHGTFTIADVKQEIHSVVVVLRENGEAQITIVTDLQLTLQGTWKVDQDPGKGIELQITGGVVIGNAKGSGRLFLREDGKSVDRLNIEAASTTTRTLTIEFVADQKSARSE